MQWKIAYAHHDQACQKPLCTIRDIEQSGFDTMPASVPGCIEKELMQAGKLKDLYFSTNTLEAQKLEDVHVWYYTKVNVQKEKQYLRFEGIDTFSDIYVNGKMVKSTDNMFLSYDVQDNLHVGENQVVVHIRPTMLEARRFTPPAVSYALQYNYAGLYVRKPSHMFGWDIMPRVVSAGLWKNVTLCERKPDGIEEVYLVTHQLAEKENKPLAYMRCFIHTHLSGAFASDYRVRIEGTCGESKFSVEQRLWHTTTKVYFDVPDCKLWWPKNAGEQNLYDIQVTLLRGEAVCDVYSVKYGIRTVELDRTEITDAEGNGEFCFRVNGKKIFILGTNWVPMDALHCNDQARLPKALALLDDIGCNMVRCWGGNVYEAEEFFEFCDRHGILVWQDFAMGCAIYPNEESFEKRLEEEAIFQIKRLRNHACLALWAGDNECDCDSRSNKRDPNLNSLTRKILKRCVQLHDYARHYLPSSPYISPEAFRGEGLMPEEHLWGPRDYFKGPYYRDTFCHFASETGYHGFPSVTSLQKFLKEPEKIFREDGIPTDEYLVHAASPELDPRAPYAYRIRLAHNQVVTLFGRAAENLEDFVRQSQISQAEAKKYFIEKFRIGKWKRTGIIWWNLLDGWPQISDAVVDYYYNRKLAYHYIKRSQQPVCLMLDEPENGKCGLIAVNDTPYDKQLDYTVRRFSDNTVVLSGTCTVPADGIMQPDNLTVAEKEKEFYYIEWSVDGKTCYNHYFTNIIDIDYQAYVQALRKYGMDQFEGF